MRNEEHFQSLIEQKINSYSMMDDAFMTAVLDENVAGAQLMLRTILEKPDLEVVTLQTQRQLQNLRGRTAILDVLARDSSGTLYNIEVQNASEGANPRRARYYSSLLDSHELPAGASISSLPESYVIFITRNDVFGQGQALYRFERTEQATNLPFGDGSHIVYVNGSFDGGESDLGLLISDMRATDPATMHFEELASKASNLKSTQSGVKKMGKFWEDLYYEAAEEGKAEGREAGLAEGRAEGRAEGLAEGLIEGRTEGAIEAYASTVRSFMSATEQDANTALATLSVPIELHEQVKKLLVCTE